MELSNNVKSRSARGHLFDDIGTNSNRFSKGSLFDDILSPKENIVESAMPVVDVQVKKKSIPRRVGEELLKIPQKSQNAMAVGVRAAMGLDIPDRLVDPFDVKEVSIYDLITSKREIPKAIDERFPDTVFAENKDLSAVEDQKMRQPGAVIAGELFVKPIVKEVAELVGYSLRPDQLGFVGPIMTYTLKGLGLVGFKAFTKAKSILKNSHIKKGDTVEKVVDKVKTQIAKEAKVSVATIEKEIAEQGAFLDVNKSTSVPGRLFDDIVKPLSPSAEPVIHAPQAVTQKAKPVKSIIKPMDEAVSESIEQVVKPKSVMLEEVSPIDELFYALEDIPTERITDILAKQTKKTLVDLSRRAGVTMNKSLTKDAMINKIRTEGFANKRGMEVLNPTSKITKEVSPAPVQAEKAVTKVKKVQGEKVSILPRKSAILKEIDDAIKKAPERTRAIPVEPKTGEALGTKEALQKESVIEFKIDGGAKIFNDKESLRVFRDKVAATPETTTLGGSSIRTPVKKGLSSKIEDVGTVRISKDGKYYTDDVLLIKGKPEKGIKVNTGDIVDDKIISDLIKDATRDVKEGRKLYYYKKDYYNDSDFVIGVSKNPLGTKKNAEFPPYVAFQSEDRFYSYQQAKLAAIEKRFPNARYTIKNAKGAQDNGALVAYVDDEPVAMLMPIFTGTGETFSKVPPFVKEATEAGILPKSGTLFDDIKSTLKSESGAIRIGAEKPEFKFPDPNIEARFQAAKGRPEPTTLQKIKDVFVSIKHKVTRDFEYLPVGKEFARLSFDLHKLEKAYGIASGKTAIKLNEIVGGKSKLSQYQLDLFRRKVILNDLVAAKKANQSLPFGFTKETLDDAIKVLDAEILKNPSVSESIIKRSKVWAEIRSDYIPAMKDIGVDVKFFNEDYFRHQVLEYAKIRSAGGTGKKLKTPTGRSHLKKRSGSELDINTDYFQAESEVMAQLLYDTEVAKTIKFIEHDYSIASKLKAKAKKVNYEGVVGGTKNANRIKELKIRKAGIIGEGGSLDASEKKIVKEITDEIWSLDPTMPFNQKIAIGFSKLKKLGYDVDELSDNAFKIISKLAKEDVVPAKQILKAISDKEQFIKELLGKDYLAWKETIDSRLIPDGYVPWQPRDGNMFFMADSIPAGIAQRLQDKAMEKILLTKGDLRKVLARGGKFKEFVVKEEVALTLDNLVTHKSSNLFSKADKAVVNIWKEWQLISPRRYSKYQIRNTTGDAEAGFIGNPSGFKKLPRATREIFNAFKNKKLTPDLDAWFDRGGFQSTLQAQEMGELNRLASFLESVEKKGLPATIATKSWKGYWRTARITTDMRESLLRYANYLDYLEQIRKYGRPNSFGGSVPEEIMALRSPEDMAFWLSNDLMGPYDRISVLGKNIREHIFPFWSWKELNFKRFIRFAQNSVRDKEAMSLIGKRLGAKSAFTAYRVGAFLTKATALWSALQAWNHLKYPELERSLPEAERGRAHIILGKDKDGNIINFTRIGIMGDFLEWFGLDAAPQHVNNWLSGKQTLREVGIDMAKSPVNIIAQGITPTIKVPMELSSRNSFFPDAFSPRPIRNRALHFVAGLGLGDEYKSIMDLPSRPYKESLSKMFVYKTDPLESAYHDVFTEKNRFLTKIGKGRDGFITSPRGDALYNLKLSIRYQDRESAEKAFTNYVLLGGTKKGIKASLRNMHPLASLTHKEKQAFINTLTDEDKERLLMAIEFYNKFIQ